MILCVCMCLYDVVLFLFVCMRFYIVVIRACVVCVCVCMIVCVVVCVVVWLLCVCKFV